MPATADQSGTEFVLARDFDAPRELVFAVWTEAEHLAHWWGPVGYTLHIEHLDLQPGGSFHYRMDLPGGAAMWGKFVYREITPPERLSYTSSFADAAGNTIRAPFSDAFPLEILNTLTLTEQDGVTTVTLRGVPVDPTAAERELFTSMFDSMNEGFAGTFRQLEDYLARVQS